MLRSLYLSLIYGVFLCAGLAAPFAMGLGYVWVDTFTPQNIAYSILTAIPVSAIMAGGAGISYLLMDRRFPPRPTLIMVLIVAMAIWVTVTTLDFAVAPEWAWGKWNWAIKTIVFAAFMPFLFRSRVQIEAFIQVYIFSAAVQVIPYGAKTLLSGGSYHANLGLLNGNSGLAEGSTLSTVAVMSVPLILWLRRHSLIMPPHRLTSLMYLGMAVAAVSASIGTYERTGLVAIVLLGGGLWLESKHKLRYGILGAIGAAALALVLIRADSDWTQRMATITQYNQEGSAHTRILVWTWTLDFVRTHPFGGGFNSYVVNSITVPSPSGGPPVVEHGRAFHNMYFEMLGEHGWVGLGLFLSLLVSTGLTLLRVRWQSRSMDGLEWCRDLASGLIISLVIVMVCGMFIGIAFQTEIYYLFALATMLAGYVRRVRAMSVLPRRPLKRHEDALMGEPVYG
jgi:probable O-glycosylation ligase (exosortase A-associated)